ncbi:MAG: dihydrofolate reductase, partial [Bacteroidales bacterium]|nr:dihydrofolate reductase [Bacteroidales bacterium]
GKDNKLLWHISEDLKRFKRITKGNKIIMGKNTYLSLPVRPLSNRENIVITDVQGEKFEGCTTVNSIDEALELCNEKEESFIIGGASIYKQFLDYANKFYLTRVNKDFEADTFLEVDFSDWKLVEEENIVDDPQNDFTYSFLTYIK